jgi:hypothetical protein
MIIPPKVLCAALRTHKKLSHYNCGKPENQGNKSQKQLFDQYSPKILAKL